MFVGSHHLNGGMRAAPRHLAWLTLTLLLTHGCAGNRVAGLAAHYQLVAQTASGGKFQHQLFLNRRRGNVLHVYIEGDGRAWLSPRRISPDPTPDNPLMLELLSLDSAPAMYLGRPCYYQTPDPECSPVWWTNRRYAEEVVDSLSRVIDQFAVGYDGLALFGHSGGGTLAMLLAGRRTDVRVVVTLAGNLDNETWSSLHDYTPLNGSLNPYYQAPLNAEIRQLHYIGAADSVVTVQLLQTALEPQQRYEMRVIPEFDHACCWARIWPEILAEVNNIAPL